MSKVMISQDSLENFSKVFSDTQFFIRMELNHDCRKENIRQLLEQLEDAWSDIYNPINLDIAKSMRKLYGNYIQAKGSGDIEKANTYLLCYLAMKKHEIESTFNIKPVIMTGNTTA